MSDFTWMIDMKVRCRCGQTGVISGVEGAGDAPENVWVNHLVGLGMQTHIHRQQQMSALMAQIVRIKAEAAADAAENESQTSA